MNLPSSGFLADVSLGGGAGGGGDGGGCGGGGCSGGGGGGGGSEEGDGGGDEGRFVSKGEGLGVCVLVGFPVVGLFREIGERPISSTLRFPPFGLPPLMPEPVFPPPCGLLSGCLFEAPMDVSGDAPGRACGGIFGCAEGAAECTCRS